MVLIEYPDGRRERRDSLTIAEFAALPPGTLVRIVPPGVSL